MVTPSRGPLSGIKVVSLAINIPGPVAAAKLTALGAAVTKVEPPSGDPLKKFALQYYKRLTRDQSILTLDLKDPGQRSKLDQLLATADLVITSSRKEALENLELGWKKLHEKFPRLSRLALFGYSAPRQDEAGHDLTYQAESGLLQPPALPKVLLADLAGAFDAVGVAVAALFRARDTGAGENAEIFLSDSLKWFSEPFESGLTATDGVLGGGLAAYKLYETRDGWVALAALEQHFWQRLQSELGLEDPTSDELQAVFLKKSAAEWEQWGKVKDLPLAAVKSTK